MSKRTRTPKSKPDAALAALQAAQVDADIIASNTFAVASEAAQRTGDMRRKVAAAYAKVITLNTRCKATGYACDVDDAVDAERRLAELQAALATCEKTTEQAIEKWRPAQRAANALAEAIEAYRTTAKQI